MICRYTTKSFVEIPPCAKKVIFITEFAIWCKNPPFYEVKKIFRKRLCAWRNFKINFSRLLFIIIFSTKILFSGPYSILTGHTKVESVHSVLGVRRQASCISVEFLIRLQKCFCSILKLCRHRVIRKYTVLYVISKVHQNSRYSTWLITYSL